VKSQILVSEVSEILVKYKKPSQPFDTGHCEVNEVNEVYRYKLDTSSRKFLCPMCRKKRFVVYIDTIENSIVSKTVGRCDREINCGYHYAPKSYFKNNSISYKPFTNIVSCQPIELTKSYHSISLLEKSSSYINENNFIVYLNSIFSQEDVFYIIKTYHLGTATFWKNATIFWQVDELNNLRAGKMIVYGKNGKRTNFINWVHSYQLKNKLITEFNLNQCLFGLHLIYGNKKCVAIVESEKTACVMSVIFDKYIWLASGTLNGLNLEKMNPLKDRKIVLYPDLGLPKNGCSPFENWSRKMNQFRQMGFDISISNLLEKNANEEQKRYGYDIADYFLKSRNSTRIIKSNIENSLDKLMSKNKNLETLIDVFELSINKTSE